MASFQGIVNAGLFFGLMVFIVFMIVGTGGGFAALWKVGAVLKQIPAWGWIVVAIIVLMKMLSSK
jgi:hypothetical protein